MQYYFITLRVLRHPHPSRSPAVLRFDEQFSPFLLPAPLHRVLQNHLLLLFPCAVLEVEPRALHIKRVTPQFFFNVYFYVCVGCFAYMSVHHVRA